MTRRAIVTSVIALPVGSGLAYATWRIFANQNTKICSACLRPVHDHSRTIANIEGHRGIYCCPACALSAGLQAQKTLAIIEFTDYPTGEPLRPKDAIFVRNSSINPCLQHQPHLNSDKQPLDLRFDRCSPSILAFRDRQSAKNFVTRFGGEVVEFATLFTSTQPA